MNSLCKSRRIGDAVSQANCDVHDAARLLVVAVETLDRMGFEIISIQADRTGNKRVGVTYGRECHSLGGVEHALTPTLSEWSARPWDGIEVRWLQPAGEVA